MTRRVAAGTAQHCKTKAVAAPSAAAALLYPQHSFMKSDACIVSAFVDTLFEATLCRIHACFWMQCFPHCRTCTFQHSGQHCSTCSVLHVEQHCSTCIVLYSKAPQKPTWQKVISNEHTKQDKVINDALHIIWERQRIILELQLQIFSEQTNLKQNKRLLAGILQNLPCRAAPAAPRKADDLP